MKLPAGFRPRIKVMGEYYQCVDIRTDVVGHDVLVCYQNRSAKTANARERMYVCALADWLEWDRRGRAADRRVG